MSTERKRQVPNYITNGGEMQIAVRVGASGKPLKMRPTLIGRCGFESRHAYKKNGYMSTKENKDFLKRLMDAPSPSGYEELCVEEFVGEIEKYAYGSFPYYDNIGNTYFKMGHGPKKILLSGHIDEVYATVVNISDDGMIAIGNAGGIDRKDLVASEVVIIKDDMTTIDGIAIKVPLHIENREEMYDKITKIEDLRVDIGCESKKEVLDMGVHPGSPLIYKKHNCMEFGENKMYGTGLDDKIGVFVAEEIFRSLARSEDEWWKEEYTVYCLAATQEEVGCRSVCVAAKEINPDVSIDFDVIFATDGDLGIKKNVYGDVSLGKGAVICYGPEKSLRLNKVLKTSSNAPYQEAATGRAGGTNTDNIQKFSKDCETTLVSIPNRSMHTRVETCDWRDVDSAVEIVTNAIIKMLI